MTRTPAWMGFEGRELGVLMPGARADFVAWSADPMTVDAAEIASLHVWQTWVGGTRVYDHAAEEPTACITAASSHAP